MTLPVEDSDYPTSLNLGGPLGIIEFAGRWDYGPKSIAKLGDPSIIERWLRSGEESMVEMVDCIFLIECSRVVTHELVRHRIASYQQESQRFVKYDEETPEEMFYTPGGIENANLDLLPEDRPSQIMRFAYHASFEAYKAMRAAGVPPQIARYVLPNGTRTRIVVKMNLREWRHVIKLRMHTSAQPEIQEVMRIVHRKLQDNFGVILFPDDIAEERAVR